MFVSLSEARELALLMREKLSVDFVNYSMPFFRRRLAYACERLNIRKNQQLVDLLHQDEFCQQFLFHMTVPVSEMFRDPGFWRALRHILTHREMTHRMKVWFPDSSSGEELYSFLIMIHQIGLSQSVDVVVNHPCVLVIEDMRKGFLPSKSIKTNLSNFERIETKDDFESFFHVVDKNYYLRSELMTNVEFRNQSFVDALEDGCYDLIFFRNSGLILNKAYQDFCYDRLISRLKSKGLFVLGIQENLSEEALQRLNCVNGEEKIFEKQMI